jgi:hypothetical protein
VTYIHLGFGVPDESSVLSLQAAARAMAVRGQPLATRGRSLPPGERAVRRQRQDAWAQTTDFARPSPRECSQCSVGVAPGALRDDTAQGICRRHVEQCARFLRARSKERKVYMPTCLRLLSAWGRPRAANASVAAMKLAAQRPRRIPVPLRCIRGCGSARNQRLPSLGNAVTSPMSTRPAPHVVTRRRYGGAREDKCATSPFEASPAEHHTTVETT